MQRFRSQRRAACQPSAAPEDRRALRGPACRHDRHVGGRWARPPADTDSALGRIRKAPSRNRSLEDEEVVVSARPKSLSARAFRRAPASARSHQGVTFPLLCHACFFFLPWSCLKQVFENQRLPPPPPTAVRMAPVNAEHSRMSRNDEPLLGESARTETESQPENVGATPATGSSP